MRYGIPYYIGASVRTKRWKNVVIFIMCAFAFMGCSDVQTKAARTYTVHTYTNGPCHVCHRGSGDFLGSETLLAPGKELCLRCHSFVFAKQYVHHAIELWGCVICHRPHGSDYPYLLRDPLPLLCFGCHIEKDILAMDAHRDQKQQCTGCHDPHMSWNKYLLKKELH